ncbi:MAG: SDR family oxidoreductase [Actinobacteria bacterium]|nr:SDR family oxidoreductase [Actinomycetota bacterium]
MKLENRVALVTAGGSGMGRESCLLFAAEGATVVVVDLDLAAAESTVEAIESTGGTAIALRCDVSSVEQLRGVFDRVAERFGVLHVLYNHAGIPGPGGLDVPEDEWERAVGVNLKSAFYGTAFGLPLLEKAGGKGSIIYTASISGLVGSSLSPHYSMTKGGVVLLMKSIAVRHAKDGIRANAICPGPTDTPMLPQFFGRAPGSANADDEVRGFVAAAVPMGRPGQPSEIARAALYLACDDSSFVTGVALPVDGGYMAR